MLQVARDGSKDILLHSAPPATPEIVSAVRSLGEVAVVFVPSLAHESFAGEWAAKFPEAKVVCPKTVMEEIKTATGRVDLAYDDLTSKSVQDLMKKYGVVEVIVDVALSHTSLLQSTMTQFVFGA